MVMVTLSARSLCEIMVMLKEPSKPSNIPSDKMIFWLIRSVGIEYSKFKLIAVSEILGQATRYLKHTRLFG